MENFDIKSATPPQPGKKAKAQAANQRIMRLRRIVFCIAAIAAIGAVVLAFKVVPYISDLLAFRREQASMPKISPFDEHWLEINPEYAGWLEIEGAFVRHPVVRGSDNEKYINTSFYGGESIFGALFMDYRCVGQFQDAPHIIIYGHQVGDASMGELMFGSLARYLDKQYLEAHPQIIFLENNNMHEFEIFSARLSDIYDPAYFLDFDTPGAFEAFAARNGAPPGTAQIITLSTCDGADNDRRMIVQGALVRTARVDIRHDETGWDIIVPPE